MQLLIAKGIQEMANQTKVLYSVFQFSTCMALFFRKVACLDKATSFKVDLIDNFCFVT